MGQEDILNILEKLGGHATVPQMRDYAKKHYPGSSMLTDRTYFHCKLAVLRRKWGLVGAIFDRRLGNRGLLVYYLTQGHNRPPKSPHTIEYPYYLPSRDAKLKTCLTAASATRNEESIGASSAKHT